MGHARLASGGQAPDQASCSGLADAGSSGRTSPAHDMPGAPNPQVSGLQRLPCLLPHEVAACREKAETLWAKYGSDTDQPTLTCPVGSTPGPGT